MQNSCVAIEILVLLLRVNEPRNRRGLSVCILYFLLGNLLDLFWSNFERVADFSHLGYEFLFFVLAEDAVVLLCSLSNYVGFLD